MRCTTSSALADRRATSTFCAPRGTPSFPSMPEVRPGATEHRPPRARPWMPVPLTLITGPANAAKAGAVLERLRAALPARPAARGADRGRRRPLPARARGRRASCSAPRCSTFPRLMREIARARRAARAPARPARARPRRPRGDRRRPAARARARRPARPASPTRAGRLFAELAALAASTPARFTAALRAWAGGGRARRTPASSPRSTRPTAAGWRRSAARRSRATPGRRSTRCAPTRRCGRGARCSSTASTT